MGARGLTTSSSAVFEGVLAGSWTGGGGTRTQTHAPISTAGALGRGLTSNTTPDRFLAKNTVVRKYAYVRWRKREGQYPQKNTFIFQLPAMSTTSIL